MTPGPEFRRGGHGQMMALTDRKAPQPSPGLLGLSHVTQTGSWEVDAVECRADRGRSRRVRLGQQRPDTVRKGVTLLPPRVKALLVPEEFLKRTAPGGAGISGVGHDIGWRQGVRFLVSVSGHP